MANTTLQIGSYSDLTDTFTLTLDLNTRTTYFVEDLQLSQPQKVFIKSFNIRTPGEAVQRAQYKNRIVSARLVIVGANTTALEAAVHSMIAAIEAPPYTIRIQLAGGSLFTHFTCVKVEHVIPYQAVAYQQGVLRRIEIAWECLPTGFTIPRQYLSNLAMNPGFEGPMGGGFATVAPTWFSDAFTNVNAYAVQAGSAPTLTPANTYKDMVLQDAANILRYYPLNEASGTSAYDIAGTGQTATYSGVNLNNTAIITTDADKAGQFLSGNSAKVTIPLGSGTLPTGNNAVGFRMPYRQNGSPAAKSVIFSLGADVSRTGFSVYIDTSGKANTDLGGGAGLVTSASSVCDNATHDIGATWDGTTLTLYVDGASTGTPTTPGANNIAANPPAFLGANQSGTANGNGLFTQAVIYKTALSSARMSALNTARTTLSGTLSGVMSIPAATRVSFGSPAWGAIYNWQVRFRFLSGATLLRWALHETDENNLIRSTISGSTFAITHVVAGVATDLATTSVTLTHEAWYWIKLTQFPRQTGLAPAIQATLYYDTNGAAGTQIATLGPAKTTDTITAVTGSMQMAMTGAAVVIGGGSGTGNTVQGFGPGGWTFSSAGAGTVSMAWDGSRLDVGMSGTGGSNTHPNGPVTSFGAARIDVAPAGALDAKLRLYIGGALFTGGKSPIHVTGAGQDVVYAGVQLKSLGLGNGATITIEYTEYDSSGTQVVAPTTLTTFTVSGGAQAAYAAAGSYTLSGHWTTNAGTWYVDVGVRVQDTTSGSANGTVWIDNVQVWDSTILGGQTTMPYCDVRSPTSPSQLVVSGLLGDTLAPAFTQVGITAAAWNTGQTFSFYLGRKALTQKDAILVSPFANKSDGNYVIDPNSYGGFYSSIAAAASTTQGLFSLTQAQGQGVYALLHRAYTTDTAVAKALTRARVANYVAGFINYNQTPASSIYYGEYFGQYINYNPVSGTWNLVNAGQLIIPVQPLVLLADPTSVSGIAEIELDSGAATATWRLNGSALMPVDSDLIVATINNASNAIYNLFNNWLFTYWGQAQARDGSLSYAYSIELWGTPNPARALATPGTQSTANININPATNPVIYLDPTQNTSLANGVNQFALWVTDNTVAPYPTSLDIVYQPQYLFPT